MPEVVVGESRSFENLYIPENPRTSKPLTFSKNGLRGLKIAQIQARSLYNTYLKCFVKKHLKKKRKKKKVAHMQKFLKKVAHMQKFKKNVIFSEFFFATGLVFERFLASQSRGVPARCASDSFIRRMVSFRESERPAKKRGAAGWFMQLKIMSLSENLNHPITNLKH
ncbi:hypothetical protein LXL04_034548 [Taraxacum kok-saghyz]